MFEYFAFSVGDVNKQRMASARLDHSRIVDEALALLMEGGLNAVSLRKVAAGLGVGVSTLYWHVRDKDALMQAVSQRIFRSCLDAVGDPSTWQEWLNAFGKALWTVQVAIPDTRKLIVLVKPDPDVRRAIANEIGDALETRGLPRAVADTAQRSVQALVTGWTTLDAAAQREDAADFERALAAMIAGWEALATRRFA